MDSDRRDERDIQHVLEDTVKASANYPKACYSSQICTSRSVDRHLGSDLRRYRYSDITLGKVLRCSFGVSDTDMDALKNRVKDIAAHKTEAYKIISSELMNAAGSMEAKTSGLYAEMAIMVFDAHQQQSDNRVKFLHSICNGRDRFAIRKPHVTPVSQKDRDNEVGLRTLRWDHVDLTSILSDIRALFFEKELLHHRDISFANVAYHIKDGRITATLLDFDLSSSLDETLEGAECPGASGSVGPVHESPSPTTVLDTPMISDVPNHPGAPAPLLTTDIAAGESNTGKCQERSGTAPFMVIESLDNSLFPEYVHDLCHELESLLYTYVWHGVGYRWKEGKCPMIWDGHKNVDLLRGWRVGTWKDVVKEKVDFLGSAADKCDYIDHEDLSQKCYKLTTVFSQRVMAIRRRMNDRRMDRRARMRKTEGLGKRAGVETSVNIEPIFPLFADIWGFERVKCQKHCCVNHIFSTPDLYTRNSF